MEWAKAKNFTILLLIIINIMLLGLNINKNSDNVVSNDRVQNISNVCRNNNININCSLPDTVMPASQLAIREYSYDYVKLQQIFFGTISDVNRTNSYNSIIFTKNDKRMVVEGSKVIYNGPREDSKKYVNGINELLGSFNIQKMTGDTVFYYQSFGREPVFSNYICIENSNDSRMSITVNFSTIVRSVGAKETVIGSDEALYAAIKSITSDIDGQRNILSVERGYYDSRTALSEEGAIPPVYAIYVNDRVYFVNAYTGSCYK